MNQTIYITPKLIVRYILAVAILITFFKLLCNILNMSEKDLFIYFIVGVEGIYIANNFRLKNE